jgi:hypothetical protein
MPVRSRLFDLCKAILTAVENGLTSEGVDIPPRAYVSAGPPAFDGDGCSLLAVWVESADRDTGLGGDPDPFEEDNARWIMRLPRIVVTLARCAPTLTDNGSAPSIVEEEAAAELLYGDATSILNAVVAAYQTGDLPTSCHGLGYGGWQVVGPSGGVVATEVRFDISLTAL